MEAILPEHKEFIDQNRNHYDTLVNAGYMRGLSGQVRSTMQEIIAKYFRPGYQTDLWCPPCVSDMVRLLYTSYDKHPGQLIVKTGFPSNKAE